MGEHAPRLPNNVIAALEDMLAIHLELTPTVERLSEHACQSFDVRALADVNLIICKLARLERLARLARRNQYGGGQ